MNKEKMADYDYEPYGEACRREKVEKIHREKDREIQDLLKRMDYYDKLFNDIEAYLQQQRDLKKETQSKEVIASKKE